MPHEVNLAVYVPIASFRASHAREFLESYPVPPPATVYGMLLSLIGEEDRGRHQGVRIALGMESVPASSLVLRKTRRVKSENLADAENAKPDFQEILTDVRFRLWIDSSGETDGERPLVKRVRETLTTPSSVTRYGALSLGESRDMVDSIILNPTPAIGLRWLIPSAEGDLMLPIWVDHVGSSGTRWVHYLAQVRDDEQPASEWFVTIEP